LQAGGLSAVQSVAGPRNVIPGAPSDNGNLKKDCGGNSARLVRNTI